MAYLKGGTVVDGNLYVEGGLRVKIVTDGSGMPLPHLSTETSSVPDRLIKFMDNHGAISYSLFSEELTDGGNFVKVEVHGKEELILSFEKSSPKITLGLDAGSISVSPKALTGLIKDSSGEYTIKGLEGKYRKLNSSAEFPDIFCYVPETAQANT